MKKGVLISAIITIVAYAIGIVVFASMAALLLWAIKEDPSKFTPKEVETAKYVAAVYFALTGVMVTGIVFSSVLLAKNRSPMSKGTGIALGIVSIVFGAEVPGIFFIIDSAMHRE